MKERLIIKNFGPIKEVDLEIRRFNVLIGDNGTGKSTIAKVLAICRNFLEISPYESERGFDITYFEKGLKKYGINEYITKHSAIFYECDDYHLKVKYMLVPKKNKDLFGTVYTIEDEEYAFYPEYTYQSNRFQKIVSSYQTVVEASLESPESLTLFFRELKEVLDVPIYVRTERVLQSVFALGRNSLDNISDSLYQFFREFDRYSKTYSDDFHKIEPLNIEYLNEDGKSLIRIGADKVVNLKDSASGYQSTVPIVLAIDYFVKQNEHNKYYIIEEPELNLYPKTQNELMKYLVDRTMNYGNKMIITTHSPYSLSSLNNLLYAFELGQNESDEVSKIIDKAYWLNPDEVSAYKLMPDGTLKDVFDREENLIKINEIDEISGELNVIFDKLIDIDNDN